MRRDWLDAKGMSSSAFRDQYLAHIVQGLARGEQVGRDRIVFALSLDRRLNAKRPAMTEMQPLDASS